MAGDVRVVLDEAGIREYLRDPSLGPALAEAAGPGITQAKANAPHRTGAGAASIHAEAQLDAGEWQARVGWDQAHFYLFFHERGTVHLPARPFLVPAFGGM